MSVGGGGEKGRREEEEEGREGGRERRGEGRWRRRKREAEHTANSAAVSSWGEGGRASSFKAVLLHLPKAATL